MRLLGMAALVLALAGIAPAQHRGGGGRHGGGNPGFRAPVRHPGSVVGTIPFRTYGSTTGFGNVLFPGMGSAPPIPNPFAFSSPFPQRLGATIGGFAGHTFVGSRRFGRTPLIYPVAYPVYVESPYAYEQAPPANVTIVLPPQQAAPPVTINQDFTESARPRIREYGPEDQNSGIRTYEAPSATSARKAEEEEEEIFLIALKDSTVYTAVRYWTQDGTLHYVTPRGRQNKVSLDLVDRAMSDRLNRGRSVEFQLPPAQ